MKAALKGSKDSVMTIGVMTGLLADGIYDEIKGDKIKQKVIT